MTRCVCCGTSLDGRGACVFCDVTLSSPPHVCLRWLELIPDEDGCEPAFHALNVDHETTWQANQGDTRSS